MGETKKKRIDKLFDKIDRLGFDSLTDAEKSFFAIFWFFRETNNGGLHTFFFNDAGRLAAYALAGLKAIGARKTADILQCAIAVFPEARVPVDQERRRSVLASLSTELQSVRLGQLSTEFFENNEDVPYFIEQYIQSHPEQFPAFFEANNEDHGGSG